MTVPTFPHSPAVPVDASAGTFTAVVACFARELAALIGEEPPCDLAPTGFIGLVERVRDVLGSVSIATWQEASEELDRAVGYLTDALTGTAGDRRSLLAWARTHLRDALEAAS
ncbi:hypothetical protein CF54_39965 [Streptomyces sp. Tu 6176]|uniref:hypothetical protein n=1 Tax=Streptomyces sp. Tu 6176 TaxID=1470557 RepID=UPI00044DD25A|nr:hypothetical protein [Streptomyces sp. Tu 6176]EYT77994.1 hypothetical protein CF54_39965 [Streptomyces sp. Tu 6176]